MKRNKRKKRKIRKKRKEKKEITAENGNKEEKNGSDTALATPFAKSRRRGVKGSLHDGFGGFDGFSGSAEHLGDLDPMLVSPAFQAEENVVLQL